MDQGKTSTGNTIVCDGSTIEKPKHFIIQKNGKALSRLVLLENDYVCEYCGDEATMSDHVIPLKADWNRRLDRTNLLKQVAKDAMIKEQFCIGTIYCDWSFVSIQLNLTAGAG